MSNEKQNDESTTDINRQFKDIEDAIQKAIETEELKLNIHNEKIIKKCANE